MQSVAAVTISALLMWAAFPPLDLGFVVFVAPAPFLWALRRSETIREAGWLGFLWGFLFFGVLLSWIVVLGFVAWLPLAAFMGLWAVLYGFLMFAVRTWSTWRWWSMAIGGWAAWDFLRARMPWGGFPWGEAGYPVGTIPWLRGSAQWIGATGWSVIVIAFAASLVLLTDEEQDRRPLEVVTMAIVALALLGTLMGPVAGGPAVRVAIVQGNSPCPREHCTAEKQQIYNSHLTLTRRLSAGSVDLIVWGEDSFGGQFNPTFNPEVQSQMAGEAIRVGAHLLAGGTRPAGPGMFDNYNVLISPQGAVVGEYLKTHPVPFGEFIPLRRLFGFVPALDQVPNDMRPGPGPVVFDIDVAAGSGTIGSVISFEAAFARHIRSEVRTGADLVVVATNEGSYGRGPASDQLIGIVRMHAASLGVDVVHAAVTGKSTLIGAGGEVTETTELFTEDILVGTVRFQERRKTLYAVVGDWVQLLAIGAALVQAIGSGRPQRDFKIRPQRRR